MTLALCLLAIVALQFIFVGANFYYAKNAEHLNLWKYFFFFGAWMMVSAPPWLMLYEKIKILTGRIWVPQLFHVGAPLVAALILGWVLFREAPEKGTLAGSLLVVAGLVLAIFWK